MTPIPEWATRAAEAVTPYQEAQQHAQDVGITAAAIAYVLGPEREALEAEVERLKAELVAEQSALDSEAESCCDWLDGLTPNEHRDCVAAKILAWRKRCERLTRERDNALACVAEEVGENLRLFEELGITEEIKGGKVSSEALADAVRKIQRERDEAREALRRITTTQEGKAEMRAIARRTLGEEE